jgi:hypothetical protein
MLPIKALYGQSILDICLQTYGSLDYLSKLIQDNGLDNINVVPFSGQIFAWDESITDKKLQNGNIIFATGALKNGNVLSIVETSLQGGGISIPNYYQPPNPVEPLLKYQKTLEVQYIAGGGETILVLTDLIGAEIVQITRETQPLRTNEFGFNPNLGKFTFVNPLTQSETLYIIYTVVVGDIGSVVPVPDAAIIRFTNEQSITITNYTTNYAPTYGQDPAISLFTYGFDQDGNSIEVEYQGEPIRTRINGLLETIVFDIGSPDSGYITIQI